MDIVDRAARLRAEGRPFALATVTWRQGPSSGTPGAKAIVHPDGSTEGWIGGACAEPSLVAAALEALKDGRPRLLTLGRADSREGVTEVPMACSSEGAMEVFVEPMMPSPTVHVVGRSPMVDTLARLVGDVGWRVVVVDEPRLSGVTEDSFVIVATQGHYDEPALEAALATPARYVGLVASAKRAAAVMEWLRGRGVGEEELTRVRAPAGMDLGPVAHEEIAVAILAEIVALRASGLLGGTVNVAEPQQAIDPVCGMTVDVAAARWVGEHGGVKVYFCAPGCQKAYESDPSAFPSRRGVV